MKLKCQDSNKDKLCHFLAVWLEQDRSFVYLGLLISKIGMIGEFQWGFNELTEVKCLDHSLFHWNYSVNVSLFVQWINEWISQVLPPFAHKHLVHC